MIVACGECHITISPSKNHYSCIYGCEEYFHSNKCWTAHTQKHHPEHFGPTDIWPIQSLD